MDKHHLIALMAAILYPHLDAKDYDYRSMVNIAYSLYDEVMEQAYEQRRGSK